MSGSRRTYQSEGWSCLRHSSVWSSARNCPWRSDWPTVAARRADAAVPRGSISQSPVVGSRRCPTAPWDDPADTSDSNPVVLSPQCSELVSAGSSQETSSRLSAAAVSEDRCGIRSLKWRNGTECDAGLSQWRDGSLWAPSRVEGRRQVQLLEPLVRREPADAPADSDFSTAREGQPNLWFPWPGRVAYTGCRAPLG